MTKSRERVYRVPVLAMSEEELVDAQYDIGLNTHHEGNPDSTIIGAIVPHAGKFRHVRHGVSLVDRSQTAITISTDGSGGIYIFPVRNSHEKHEIPADKTLRTTLHAALTMIAEENLPASERLNQVLKHYRTHPAHSHQGDQASETTKSNFSRTQIGLKAQQPPRHRKLTPEQAMGPDLIPF